MGIVVEIACATIARARGRVTGKVGMTPQTLDPSIILVSIFFFITVDSYRKYSRFRRGLYNCSEL